MTDLSLLEQLCFSTTRIETEDSFGNKYSGTGFFFDLSFDEGRSIPLIITNKHVVRNMVKGKFRFTKADSANKPNYTDHFTITFDVDFEEMWTFHPEPDIDLCVLAIQPLVRAAKAMGHTLFFRSLDNSLIPSKEQIKELDAVEDILMIGYPNGLWDSVNNMPIVRRGTTATDVKLNYDGKKEFVIDAACFPGSSGSPVLICNVGGYADKKGNLNWGHSRVFLLGALYAGPQLTVTGEIKIVNIPNIQQKALSISHIPNNLGYIIKSECIFDFIPVIKKNFNL
ncbi:MAG TPA: serine protease [Bacteroidales bacterium]|jgi:hypothetical protein|nr:serine protease [Bacteroidales bacterium]